jgi:beta-lactamase regulating signal transducer with metallopeptidase domain
MTTIETNWISPSAMHAWASALLHFLWQGTAIAALAAAALALCRRASTRYAVALGALTLMFLAPIATFLSYVQQPPAATDAGIRMTFAVAPRPIARGNTAPKDATTGAFISSPSDSWRWMVQIWLLGVTFFSLRFAGGFLLLDRQRRSQFIALSPRVLQMCHALQDQLGISRAIRYCQCKWLQAPAVIGWFRPIVFLPATALTGLTEEQLQSVIAHELAHIRRLDPFVNVFQVLIETLLFYHPAVWWLNKRIRVEREHCCDEIAVSTCGNAVEYARALTLMEEWRSAPMLATAANAGSLRERISRVLGLKTSAAEIRGINLTGSILCLAGALAAGNALFTITHPIPAQAKPSAVRLHAKVDLEPVAFVAPAPMPAQQSTPAANPAPQPSAGRPQDSTEAAAASSYIDQMKAVGLSELTVDQLIALKVQDVTPEYVRALQQQGLHPTVEKIIGMRVQGVTPEYVQQLHAAGLNPDENQVIALKVQGVDAAYYRQLVDAGIKPDVEHLIALKVQGVTPEYVRALQAAGLTPNVDQVIALKVQDVTPEYMKAMHELGIDPRAEDAIALRVQDVTPEYVRAIRALGLTPSTQQLIALRVQDVTPEYIQALQSAGFKFSVSELISAKVQDVTPEFIQQAVKHGFKDLTLQKLIELRRLGILDQKADL